MGKCLSIDDDGEQLLLSVKYCYFSEHVEIRTRYDRDVDDPLDIYYSGYYYYDLTYTGTHIASYSISFGPDLSSTISTGYLSGSGVDKQILLLFYSEIGISNLSITTGPKSLHYDVHKLTECNSCQHCVPEGADQFVCDNDGYYYLKEGGIYPTVYSCPTKNIDSYQTSDNVTIGNCGFLLNVAINTDTIYHKVNDAYIPRFESYGVDYNRIYLDLSDFDFSTVSYTYHPYLNGVVVSGIPNLGSGKCLQLYNTYDFEVTTAECVLGSASLKYFSVPIGQFEEVEVFTSTFDIEISNSNQQYYTLEYSSSNTQIESFILSPGTKYFRTFEFGDSDVIAIEYTLLETGETGSSTFKKSPTVVECNTCDTGCEIPFNATDEYSYYQPKCIDGAWEISYSLSGQDVVVDCEVVSTSDVYGTTVINACGKLTYSDYNGPQSTIVFQPGRGYILDMEFDDDNLYEFDLSYIPKFPVGTNVSLSSTVEYEYQIENLKHYIIQGKYPPYHFSDQTCVQIDLSLDGITARYSEPPCEDLSEVQLSEQCEVVPEDGFCNAPSGFEIASYDSFGRDYLSQSCLLFNSYTESSFELAIESLCSGSALTSVPSKCLELVGQITCKTTCIGCGSDLLSTKPFCSNVCDDVQKHCGEAMEACPDYLGQVLQAFDVGGYGCSDTEDCQGLELNDPDSSALVYSTSLALVVFSIVL
eukprot:TRINITY_DN4651_c0_g1_i1.p1 TRINITY_DN4651_c0_g1~~TRINITY_DN4651_c0_g1_i1.p1  ORF type:complete len:793 (+),score=151.99 TRINITY_DN4651_c0_g1_i1:282-2381(+)